MITYIALLRGINVGGKKKIKMAELRQQLAVLGFENIRTYIQSGNIAFETSLTDTKALAQQIKANIFENYGFEVPTLVVPQSEIYDILKNNPFLNDEIDIKLLHVTMLYDVPSTELAEAIDFESENDKYRIVGKNVYLYFPNGYGRTKLTNNFFEQKLKTSATTRNWKTMKKLATL